MTEADKLNLVQRQLEAYNKRDLDLFCSYFHDQVEVYRINKINQLSDFQTQQNPVGIEKFRETYRDLFTRFPELHCHLKSRIVLNDCIIDEEQVFYSQSDNQLHAIAIYKFKDQKIYQIWFAR